jgi:hypothetical protein
VSRVELAPPSTGREFGDLAGAGGVCVVASMNHDDGDLEIAHLVGDACIETRLVAVGSCAEHILVTGECLQRRVVQHARPGAIAEVGRPEADDAHPAVGDFGVFNAQLVLAGSARAASRCVGRRAPWTWTEASRVVTDWLDRRAAHAG